MVEGTAAMYRSYSAISSHTGVIQVFNISISRRGRLQDPLVEVSLVWTPAENCAQGVPQIFGEAHKLQFLACIKDGKH